ncbi:hypothetical protein Tco_0728791 [Tanacetum coccineum]|uniref:Uncharacterized protein n=1 Tax=Tanacetum coccineum TaxID=301880 RepID=A0ABQ4YPK3_9ASTR
MIDGSALGSFGRGGGNFLEEKATGNNNIKQCLRKVADGHFTRAVKVLSSFDVAPYCDDTIKALEAKHPYKPPPSKPSITFFEHPLVAEIDSVFGCIKYIDDGTVIGDSEEVSKVLDVIKLREGLFPIDIRRPSSGVKLLGGAVSRDADFISGLAIRRAANAVDLMSLLPQLHDSQSELLLLQSCMGLNSKGFTSGQAALKAASCKVTKHDKACNENQHVFIPFAFDTFGFFAPEAVELLRRVQRVMHINVMTPRSTDVGSKRIGFAI